MEANYNKVSICGWLEAIGFSHRVADTVFYKTNIHSTRPNGDEDIIPVIIPEAVRPQEPLRGEYMIQARVCSRDDHSDGRSKLRLSLLADSIVPVRGNVICNNVELEGYVCKGPFYRETKLGKHLCQMIIATNRNSKSYYIPCVCFADQADRSKAYEVGDKLLIKGRIQSREYLTSDYQEGITYEVVMAHSEKN